MKKIIYLFLSFANVLWLNVSMAQDADANKTLWTADWSPDGKSIAVGGDQGTLMIFSGKKFKQKRTFPLPDLTITALSWHPKENLLVIATQNDNASVQILNLDDNSFTRLTNIDAGGARGIDWNQNGQYLAVADNGGRITIHNKAGEYIRTIKKDNTKSYLGLSWHPSKDIFITVSKNIRIFDIEGNLIKMIPYRNKDIILLCVRWHPSGDFFVTGDYGFPSNGDTAPLLQLWTEDGTFIKSIVGSKAEYRNISWTKNGKRLAAASDALRIFNRQGEIISETSAQSNLWGIDWSPNGKFIVTSSEQGSIKIYNKKGKLKRILK